MYSIIQFSAYTVLKTICKHQKYLDKICYAEAVSGKVPPLFLVHILHKYFCTLSTEYRALCLIAIYVFYKHRWKKKLYNSVYKLYAGVLH